MLPSARRGEAGSPARPPPPAAAAPQQEPAQAPEPLIRPRLSTFPVLFTVSVFILAFEAAGLRWVRVRVKAARGSSSGGRWARQHGTALGSRGRGRRCSASCLFDCTSHGWYRMQVSAPNEYEEQLGELAYTNVNNHDLFVAERTQEVMKELDVPDRALKLVYGGWTPRQVRADRLQLRRRLL